MDDLNQILKTLISDLRPIHDLLGYLSYQEQPVTLVHLSQWWQNVFETGWQSVEAFLNAQITDYAWSQPSFRRSSTKSIRRGKLIHFQQQQLGCSVVLVITLIQEEAINFGIRLQVFPKAGEMYLPVGLKLAVIDELGTTFFEVSSGSNKHVMQMRPFGGQLGELFRIQISLSEDTITENFIV